WVAESCQGASRGPLKARAADALPPASDPSAVRPILSQGLGVLRDRHGIERAIRGLYPIASGSSAASDPALVGLMIAVAAWRREESRGGHYRSDFPDALPSAVPSTHSLAEGFAAGLDITRCALQLVNYAIRLTAERPDGSVVAPGDVIAAIEGPARALLTGERTALNFLCHLSGVATATASLVSAAQGTKARIVCTRKTTPGLRALEKYAV